MRTRMMLSAVMGLVGVVTADATGGEFQNLDFESANLPVIPANQSGGWVPVERALPGWQAFLGYAPLEVALHNDLTLGAASISILGPNYGALIYEGNFGIRMKPGPRPIDAALVDISIAQSGIVPSGTLSLHFIAKVGGFAQGRPDAFGVFINDEALTLYPDRMDTPGGDPVNYAADVSAYAGQEVTLKFTSFILGPTLNSLTLDGIAFSPLPVPEPGPWALLGLGGLAWLAGRRRRH